jgi:diguanylate cyclase (GGDEF)-like protein
VIFYNMTKHTNLFGRFLLIVAEVVLIAYLEYQEAQEYISLDVLYCLPVIQAARLGAIQAMRRTDTNSPTIIAILIAIVWSMVEASIVWPHYPLKALALNIFTRSVTFTVIARVVTKLWQEREYGRRDMLTSLSNRVEFFEKFETEQMRSERSGRPYSLLFIDINQFKMLNDEHGHHVGDKALKELAEVLQDNSRRIDIVSRFGGDEFVVLFPETDEQSCEILANRIKLAAEEVFRKRGWQQISLSIGHVTETGKELSADEILRKADSKMYSAKRSRN